MPETQQLLATIGVFLLIQAFPSAAYGVNLARRAGRPFWHGLLAGFLLPWFGLLFIPRPGAGQERTTGFAHYATVMLFVAAGMELVALFTEVNETTALLVAAIVAGLLFLAGALGLLFGRGVGLPLALSIAVSVAVGLWVSVLSNVVAAVGVSGGFWVLQVAVIVGYVSLAVAPFGLKLDPLSPPAPELPQPHAPPPLVAQPPQPGPHWGSAQQGQTW